MPFPKKTLDEIFHLSFNHEDDSYDSIENMRKNCIKQECYIELIAKILKLHESGDIRPLLPKQSATIQKQPEEVLRELSFNYNKRCDIELKRLGHILNKLAKFQDSELTDEFLTTVTEKFNEITKTQSKSQKISDLLRDFHMRIAKTPTESQQQKKAVEAVHEYIGKKGLNSAEFVFYGEVLLYSKNNPFVLGNIDGAVLIPCVLGNIDGAVLIPCEEKKYRLITIEYDGGIGKTKSDKEDRMQRYAKGALGNISFTAKDTIKDEYVTQEFDVLGVEVVSIQRDDYLPKDRLDRLLEEMGIAKKNGRLCQRKITPSVKNKYPTLSVQNRYAALEEGVDDETRSNPPCDAYVTSPNPKSTSLSSEPNKYAALEEGVDDETRSNPPCDAYVTTSPKPESTSLLSEPSGGYPKR